jgi:hypothetical protein
MWRLVCVLCLLPTSGAFAGEVRAQLQVGFTITGKASAASPAPAATMPHNVRISVPLPPERPAIFGPRDALPFVR